MCSRFDCAKAQLRTKGFILLSYLTTSSVTISADIYANLRNKGTPIDDIDILIAGIAIANNLIIVTNNLRDFEKIESLEIQDWSQ